MDFALSGCLCECARLCVFVCLCVSVFARVCECARICMCVVCQYYTKSGILCVCVSLLRAREREREKRKWRQTIALELGMSSHFPLSKFTLLVYVVLKSAIISHFLFAFFVPSLSNFATTDRRDVKIKDWMYGFTILLSIEKSNQIMTKNYWKKKKRSVCVRWLEVINSTWNNLQIANHKSRRRPLRQECIRTRVCNAWSLHYGALARRNFK